MEFTYQPKKTEVTQEERFNLSLTRKEADVLCSLFMGHLIGSNDGPRGITSNIARKLESAGANSLGVIRVTHEDGRDVLKLENYGTC